VRYLIIDCGYGATVTNELTDQLLKDAYNSCESGPVMFLIDMQEKKEYYQGMWVDIGKDGYY